MPARKTTKKTARAAKTAKKKATTSKKTAAKKKVAAKKKAQPQKKVPAKKKEAAEKVIAPQKPVTPVAKPEEQPLAQKSATPAPVYTGEMVECRHCGGVGKCTYGEVYDMDRHQSLFAEQRLTSCIACLNAAGKPHNSKKLVSCRICGGTGKVPRDEGIEKA